MSVYNTRNIYLFDSSVLKNSLLLCYRSITYRGIVQLNGRLRVDHPTNNTTMVEPFAGVCGMAFAFPAASPRQPLRKGSTEGGVAGLNSLTAIAIGAHEHQLFDKLLWGLVTSTIFVRCQRLIARKLAVLFGFNRGVRPFYAACCFDDASRGSVSCLLNACIEN